MSAPLLSLCMIVRNEQAMLPDCLASVAGLADEMVIVDTGSTDATISIASAHGARVLCLPWQDDFAAARNHGLAAASGQWILVLDADDRLEPDDLPIVQELLRASEYDAYLFRTISYVGDRPGGSSVTCPHIRLFRNHPECRYRGRIHEWVQIPDAFRMAHRPVRIYHHGYLNHLVRDGAKIQRNLRILQELHQADPQDAFTLYNLGTEWVRLGQWEQAIDAFTQALGIVERKAGWAPDVVKKLAIALMHVQRHDEAWQLLTRGLRAYQAYTDLQYLLGCLYHRVGRYSKALAAYQQCLEMGEAPACYSTDDGVGSFQALLGAALVHRDMGNAPQAVELLLRSLQVRPDFTSALAPLLGCLVRAHGLRGSLAFLAERLALSPPIYRKLAAAALEQGEYRLSLALLRKAVGPDCAADRLLQGHCRLGLGQPEQAASQWRRIDAAAEAYREACHHLELAKWLLEPDAPPPLPPDADVEQRLNLATKALEAGQAERAAAVLQPLWAADARTRLEVAETLSRLGAHAQAARWAQALLAEPEVAAQGRSLLLQGAGAARDWAEAGRLAGEILGEDPFCFAAYVYWAQVFLRGALRFGPGMRTHLAPLQLWKWRGSHGRGDRLVRHRPQ